ncbi:MAG: VUT family protein [Stellaceae bacterium]
MSYAVAVAREDHAEGLFYLAGFMLCIPVANWMIGHVGTFCVPHGPCMLPVAPGLAAPSGVVTVGLALVLRDLVQRRLGRLWSLGAIVAGSVLSAALATGALVAASATAFLLSELADFAVYSPLQQRRFVLAVLASSAAGLVIDSILFLSIALGSLDFLWGQIVGKVWMVVLSLPFIWWLRRRDARRLAASSLR